MSTTIKYGWIYFFPLKIFKICQNQTTFLWLIHNLKLIQLKLTHTIDVYDITHENLKVKLINDFHLLIWSHLRQVMSYYLMNPLFIGQGV
jgi:uncharacterized protein YhhL (DUF1145 family)